jgi:hypothetical protein
MDNNAKARLKTLTGPEQNIGPELSRDDVGYQQTLTDISHDNPDSKYYATPDKARRSFDAAKKKGDNAQAESQKPKNTAPSFKKGGSVSSRADGCAQRGKTKGRYL